MRSTSESSFTQASALYTAAFSNDVRVIRDPTAAGHCKSSNTQLFIDLAKEFESHCG
jgi:hypothetical protein